MMLTCRWVQFWSAVHWYCQAALQRGGWCCGEDMHSIPLVYQCHSHNPPARYGPHAAIERMYDCPGLLRAVTRGAPRHDHDALALGVLRALREGGCSAASQTDAVLVNAAAAGHVAVIRWAMQVGGHVHGVGHL